MQLIARDRSGAVTHALLATRGVAYHCLECGGVVRLRQGVNIRPHFYHSRAHRNCEQSGKSATHLAIQEKLRALLPTGEAELEVPFPEKGRIADLVWERHKLVFEVQCSSITADEVAQRNDDYGALGYQVIWILHQARFNKRRVTAAEAFLQDKPHYFTTVGADGRGFFYDQISLIEEGVRIRSSPRFRVEFSDLLLLERVNSLSDRSKARLSHWKYCFKGEAAYCEQMQLKQEICEEWRQLELRSANPSLPFWQKWKREGIDWLHRAYNTLLFLLLERVAR